ncbi:MAG: hypothetical protein H7Y20_05870 [Bryobacteraceae bacterium]|nr:hypothetical protein [Bryobacteraceae bacterium]
MSGEDGAGVTLSNADCAFMRLGTSDILDNQSRLDTKTPQIQVLAGGQIDGPKAGIAKQGGDSYFLQRFSLRTHSGYDAATAMKFSLEHQNPSVAGWVRGGKAYPEQTYSAATLSNPNVVLWSLKPAEEGIGSGVIARLWNLSSTPQDYSVSLAGGIQSGRQTTHIETDLADLPVSNGAVAMKAAPTQIQTIRLRPAGTRR